MVSSSVLIGSLTMNSAKAVSSLRFGAGRIQSGGMRRQT
jgi:hypothetical protein